MGTKRAWLVADGNQAEARIVAWAGPVPSLQTWFREGRDVHLEVTRQIARVVQENKIKLPRDLYARKPWASYTKEDKEERDLSKRTVHGNNYGMGPLKYATVVGLAPKFAEILQSIYFALFPEIKTNYHAWIDSQLAENRTLITPYGFRKVFFGPLGPELSRSGYAFYAQSTIGEWLIRLLNAVCECFEPIIPGVKLWSPSTIAKSGLNVRMQTHDSINIALDDDRDTVDYAVQVVRRVGEEPIIVRGEPLVVPVDFKIGPNLKDLKSVEEYYATPK